MNKKSISSMLKHRIFFLRNIAKTDIFEASWKQVREDFAHIKSISDNKFNSIEGLCFGNVLTEKYFLFKVRFSKEINEDMRISFKNRIFEIKRIVNQNESSKILNIIALEV